MMRQTTWSRALLLLVAVRLRPHRSDLLTDPFCAGRDAGRTEDIRDLQDHGARELAMQAFLDNGRDAGAALRDLLDRPGPHFCHQPGTAGLPPTRA